MTTNPTNNTSAWSTFTLFLDEVGENESHALASLMEIVGVLVERYEDEHVPELIE